MTQAMTIDDLGRRAGLPVRTIREYHTMRVLPPPERKGRIGLYDAGHIQRLELVARLQHRGYSLAGIRDLLDAWDNGTELTALLGVQSGPVPLDETPLRLTRAELFSWQPVTSSGNATDLPGFLARGRMLLLQGVASVLADRLAAALLHQADDLTDGAKLRVAIGRISAGAMRDSAGTLQHRSSS